MSQPILSRRQLLQGSVATGMAFGLSALLAGCAKGSAVKNSTAAAKDFIRTLPQAPGFYPFSVGAIQGTVISDGTVALPIEAVVTNGNAADIAALLERNFLPTAQVNAPLNTVVLKSGGKTILIDTGYGEEGTEANGFQQAVLASQGISPTEVDAVFVTHAHPDHLWGLMDGEGKPFFPNAEIILHENEYNFFGNSANSIAPLSALFEGVERNLLPLKDRIKTVKGGDAIAPGITVVEAFGHTPGHCAVRIADGDDQLLITADTANHHILFPANPDYHFSYDLDPAQAVKTRRAIFDQLATDKTKLLAYHFPFPGIGYIRRTSGGAYEFVPAVWGA
jgi:glyoxylase-like metal-dependent hydrolase (beta-lactamase superfamily II)